MTLRLYDTLYRDLLPVDVSDPISIYVCGVTPYDTTHLGHARVFLIFDVLIRYLEFRGHAVRYVQNITDVDDSIIARARALGEDYKSLGDRYVAILEDDMRGLNMRLPDAMPRATEAIKGMQLMIAALIESGHAYLVGSDVFFDVATTPDYGKLSGLDRARMLEIEASQDGSTVHDPRKRDALDLLLWRGASDEPVWDSPWGPGRPGWHIECSALAVENLGPSVDIHGGGVDLEFPHHSAEIVQTESATEHRPFVKHWVHVAMVNLDGAKMSKSDGNMVFVRELLKTVSPAAVRIAVLETHYRTELEAAVLDYVKSGQLGDLVARHAGEPGDAPADFTSRLDDDLDIGGAIAVLEAEVRSESPDPKAVGAMARILGLV